MNENDAVEWLRYELDVSRETLDRLEDFAAFLRRETANQNLVSAATLETLWSRHIVDSAQLLIHAPADGDWLDLGSGAGFPGLIVAVLGSHRVILLEPRRKRVEFLMQGAALLGVNDRVTVVQSRAETADLATFDVISARAVAPLDRLLTMAQRFATGKTRWLLPKGRTAHAELDAARRTWQGDFRVEPSVTDAESAIIVAEQVRPKEPR
jgi:16S rRNA (guanine527-N7)-methyltransferase